MLYRCECCGFYSLPEESAGSDNICPVCYWQDDLVQLEDINFEGGANGVSLNKARKNYALFAASEDKFTGNVRKPLYHELPENQQF